MPVLHDTHELPLRAQKATPFTVLFESVFAPSSAASLIGEPSLTFSTCADTETGAAAGADAAAGVDAVTGAAAGAGGCWGCWVRLVSAEAVTGRCWG
jgi:hypothetical protein